MVQLPRVVYHLAEAANWPSIQRTGLLPAAHLLQRFVHDDAERAALQQRQRLRHVVLAEGVEIRDQRPLPQAALTSCLIDLTAAQWYNMLNERVFFWLDTGWASEAAALGIPPRRRSHTPVEVTVTGAVPDAGHYIVDVTPLHAGGHFSPA